MNSFSMCSVPRGNKYITKIKPSQEMLLSQALVSCEANLLTFLPFRARKDLLETKEHKEKKDNQDRKEFREHVTLR